MRNSIIKHSLLFGFLGLGALWEILDKYQELMTLLSGYDYSSWPVDPL